MDATRITLARVLELGIRVSWREATSIVHEALSGARPTKGAGTSRVTADSCLLTRGGNVVLEGTAAQAHREAVVRLLDDLLESCSDAGRFAGAVANGTALEMIEELGLHTTPKRRRVEVAAVAIRGLAAAADADRTRVDAEEQDWSADLADFIAAPTPVPSPTVRRPPWPAVRDQPADQDQWVNFDHEDLLLAVDVGFESPPRQHAVAALAIGAYPRQNTRTRPSPRERPASFSIDPPVATPPVTGVPTGHGARAIGPAPVDWVKRAGAVALACLVVALAAAGLLVRQTPVTQRSAADPAELVEPNEPVVEPSEPIAQPSEPAIERSELAVEPPAIEAPLGLDGQAPVARDEPAPLREAADPPSVPLVAARRAPRGLPGLEASSAPAAPAPNTFVRPVPSPAGGPAPAAENTTMIPASPPRSSPSAPAPPPPALASPASVPPSAVAPSSAVASPSALASSPVETAVSASKEVPPNAVGRSAGAEAETRAIENVLGRYRTAFNSLDAGAASAVWPTVDEKTLAKAFARLESHDVSFDRCQIEIGSNVAEAACSGSARYVPSVGSRTPKDEVRQWRFSLRKASGGWLIDRVDAR